HALRESFKFAGCEECWITVTSVAPSYEGDLAFVGMVNVRDAMRQPTEKALSDAREAALSAGAMIKTVYEEGEPYERIVDLAEAENCDLIVTGRTGKGGIKKTLIGSVAARVIGYSRTDVLVVPPEAEIGWSKILFATDGSKFSEEAEAKAIDFAKSYGSQLKVIRVVDVPAEFYAESPNTLETMIEKARMGVVKIKRRAESEGVDTETFIGQGESPDIILNFAKEMEIGTIILGSHGRTGLRRLLMGSVAEKVIGYAPCPVLIAR
ncbi:MAG TPA: universal stress protein, partial [Dissulfurispiraceae bacterium]|nr:universal stress protein [Dissulfurispiraceae bacterium]